LYQGDIRSIKSWCGEAVYNKLEADIKARKTDGHVFDSNILSLDENQLILKLVEDMGPVIVGEYMVQQINCIRNKQGEIIEVSTSYHDTSLNYIVIYICKLEKYKRKSPEFEVTSISGKIPHVCIFEFTSTMKMSYFCSCCGG
jgi:hypothetical protein